MDSPNYFSKPQPTKNSSVKISNLYYFLTMIVSNRQYSDSNRKKKKRKKKKRVRAYIEDKALVGGLEGHATSEGE